MKNANAKKTVRLLLLLKRKTPGSFPPGALTKRP
jgi:hypothetical protein